MTAWDAFAAKRAGISDLPAGPCLARRRRGPAIPGWHDARCARSAFAQADIVRATTRWSISACWRVPGRQARLENSPASAAGQTLGGRRPISASSGGGAARARQIRVLRLKGADPFVFRARPARSDDARGGGGARSASIPA